MHILTTQLGRELLDLGEAVGGERLLRHEAGEIAEAAEPAQPGGES